MKDVIFLQFYGDVNSPIDSEEPCTMLGNGFSFVWDDCKNSGDFLWVNLNTKELPINKGKVYASVLYLDCANKIYDWAEKYPDIDFVFGGPEIFNIKRKKLNNIRESRLLAEEEIFGIHKASTKWKLEIPDEVVSHDKIVFGYTAQRTCYWQRCKFCYRVNMGAGLGQFNSTASNLYIPETSINKKFIWLISPSISPKYLIDNYSKLPIGNDIEYSFYYRGDESEAKALSKIFNNGDGPDPSTLHFNIGVEFPSNRMLNLMDKGVTIESLLNTIKVASSYGSHIRMTLILNWDKLVESDINDAEYFMSELRNCYDKYKNHMSLTVFPLGIPNYSPFTDEYLLLSPKVLTEDGYITYYGLPHTHDRLCWLMLDDVQLELNQTILQIYNKYFPTDEYDTSDYEKLVGKWFDKRITTNRQKWLWRSETIKDLNGGL